ncbi:hypothetical protein DOY81_007863, partial [Sarcophaga bullata]
PRQQLLKYKQIFQVGSIAVMQTADCQKKFFSTNLQFSSFFLCSLVKNELNHYGCCQKTRYATTRRLQEN